MTNLMEAVLAGDEDAVVRALRAGASAEAKSEGLGSALYRAALGDRPGIVRLLLASGADPNRPSGEDTVDLPLCGAASGGHTEVIRALLAAGAQPDLREELDFTAMTWAAQKGYGKTAEVLLAHGADPDLPGPGGVPPLVTAAGRGSAETVRVLLRHGASARQEALAEARRWLALDVEQEVRRQLAESYGSAYEAVARRVREDDGLTVVVDLIGENAPWASAEQQTGHGAIATLLEAELGIQAPFEELAERALRYGDATLDDWAEPVFALQRRGDEETFQAAAAWAADGGDPLRQAFAADVLAQLGFAADKPFVRRSLPILRDLARTAVHPELIQSAVLALGHHGDPAALPEILQHAAHPDRDVRHRVTLALHGLVPADDTEALAALITLTQDPDEEVRDWATLDLSAVDADTPQIREALASLLDDEDPDTAAEAARGLAMRQDPRAVGTLVRILADEDPEGYAHSTALEAIDYVEDEAAKHRLTRTTPRCR
ncbi:HEAT repeat domain-containing protein [Streptomyces sp. NPDC050738]|uniref:HEAT repeat domain-containing protein n=1 Tax=Streptomyces sp. NPDC050738 TaxID=3154744 RepID=UPI00342D0BA4